MRRSWMLAVFLIAACGSQSLGDLVSERADFAGSIFIDLSSKTQNGNSLVVGPTTVYDNIAAPSAVSAATSAADLNQTWGDRVTLADTGYFDSITVSVFNSSSGGNVNPITTATINYGFYDATTFDATNLANNTALFEFSGNVNFGTGLNPGFFSTVTFSGLKDFFGIPATSFTLTNSNIMFTQRLSNIAGGSLRAGVVTYTLDNIGTQYNGNNNWYRNSPATPASGYVAFGDPTSNRLAATIGLTSVPEPGATLLLGVAGVLVGFSRRRVR